MRIETPPVSPTDLRPNAGSYRVIFTPLSHNSSWQLPSPVPVPRTYLRPLPSAAPFPEETWLIDGRFSQRCSEVLRCGNPLAFALGITGQKRWQIKNCHFSEVPAHKRRYFSPALCPPWLHLMSAVLQQQLSAIRLNSAAVISKCDWR